MIKPKDVRQGFNPETAEKDALPQFANDAGIYLDIDMPEKPLTFDEGLGATTNQNYKIGATYTVPKPKEAPTFFETLGATFRLQNTIGSMASAANINENVYTEGYNPLLDPLVMELDENDKKYFLHSTNPEYTKSLLTSLQQEQADRQVERDSGGMGMALTMGVSVLDPINIPLMALPVAGALRAGQVAKSAAMLGAEGFAVTAAAEGVFQSTQQLRTKEETQKAILAGTIVGTVLGGGVAKSVGNKPAAISEYRKLTESDDFEVDAPPVNAGSVGAAKVQGLVSQDIDDYALVMSDSILGKLALKTSLSPEAVLSLSESLTARQAGMALADNALLHKGHLEGKSLTPEKGSIESRIQTYRGAAWELNQNAYGHYADYRKFDAESMTQKLRTKIEDAAGKSDYMSWSQFKDEVFWAIDSGKVHEVDAVNKAAKEYQQFFNEMKKISADDEVGLISKERAESDTSKYIHRKWSHEKIIAQRDVVRQRFAKWFDKKRAGLNKNLEMQKDAQAKDYIDTKIQTTKDDIAAKGYENEIDRARLQRLEYDQKAVNGEAIVSDELSAIDDAIDAQLKADVERYNKAWDAKISKIKDDKANIKGDTAARQDYINERLAKGTAYKKLQGERKKIINDLDEAMKYATYSFDQLLSFADDTIDNIIGINTGVDNMNNLPDFLVHKAGAFKDRTFDIPNAMVKDLDIIDTDIENIANQYTRSVAPQIELSRDYGDANAKELFDDLKDSWQLIKQLEIEKLEGDLSSGKITRKAMDKRMNELAELERKDKRNIEAMVQRLLGTYKRSDDPTSMGTRTIRALKNLMYTSKLGGMQLSALPDIARPIMTYGFKPVMTQLIKAARTPEKYKAATWEVRRAGAAIDMTTNQRMSNWADLTDDIVNSTKAERGLQKVADHFGNITGMNYHNDLLKGFSGSLVQDSLIRHGKTLAEGGKLNKKAMKEVFRTGVTEDMLKRIGQQFKKHGDDTTDLLVANTKAWDDIEAQQAFRSAVNQMTNKIIVTTGVGDMPLFFGGDTTMSLILQFKSFIFSSHNRVMLAGLQQRDAAALEGLLIAGFLGSAVYGIKSYQNGTEITDNPTDFVFESLDRAGVLGYLNEPAQILAKVSGGNLSITKALGGEETSYSRYASRNMYGALFGVSANFLADSVSVIRALTTGEVEEGDVRAFRRNVPLQNLSYMRWLFDHMQTAAEDALVTE